MSTMDYGEQLALEEALGMSSGYVGNFSNASFDRFIYRSVGVNIRTDEYARSGESKANRMREFWHLQPNNVVAKLLEDMSRHWQEVRPFDGPQNPPPSLASVAARLRSDIDGSASEASLLAADNDDFHGLVGVVNDAIQRGQPEAALDRLHTYLVHKFRQLCEKHELATSAGTPLNGLAGQYVNHLRQTGRIESGMSSRILKRSVEIWDAYNDVRNNHTYAHANTVLGKAESRLIVNYVTNTVHFVEQLESVLDADSDL